MFRPHLLLLLAVGFFCSCSEESSTSDSETQGDKKRRSSSRGPDGGSNFSYSPTEAGSSTYAKRNWPTEEEEPTNEWTEQFKNATTSAQKIEVVERKQSSGPEDLAPLIRMSLRDSDERVRMEAVKMLPSFVSMPPPSGGRSPLAGPRRSLPGEGSGPGSEEPENGGGSTGDGTTDNGTSPPETTDADPQLGSQDPLRDEVVDLVVGATYDENSEVRILAMEAALELQPERQIEIFSQTIETPEYDVRKMTIVELGRMMSKPAFDVLITGLQSPDPNFQVEVNKEIHLLVNRRFRDYESAQSWWEQNAARYSDNMIDVGPQ